ncbi:hypothetical protein ACLOAV_010019 [Pseudogymnoascus australis]
MPAPSSSSNRWTLSWTSTSPPPTPLPPFITRTFITTPSGPLELLSATPDPARPRILQSPILESPILFVHGGFGCAAMFIPWLSLLAAHGYNVHALSIRGHGQSWTPGFLGMALLTTAYALATDIRAGIAHLETLFDARGEVVLAGHSAGVGSCRWSAIRSWRGCRAWRCWLGRRVLEREFLFSPTISRWRGVANAWVVSDHVYRAWWTLDPLFLPRMFLRDWLHPRSPLSSSELVKAAFFCPSFPIDWVKPFEKLMSEYESLRWPVSTMWRGYVDPRRVLLGCGMRLFVLAAELDQLMKMDLMVKTTAEYAGALKQMGKDGYDIKGGD